MSEKTIKVDYLARVEGEGALLIRFHEKQPTEVKLQIFEPPRFFEAFLRGRAQYEAPDITSRICGICPVAYLMSSCAAIEDILGLRVEGELRALRRLLYCGEWIESHALHVFLLHAPDFLGYEDALSMAKAHPEVVRRGLRMKKAGNAIVSLLGGREVHPVNIRVGGFYRAPYADELRSLLPELVWAREAAKEALAWLAGFSFPDLERDYEFVALKSFGEYPILGERIVSSRGLDIDVREYDAHFLEEHVSHSNALHSRLQGRGAYLCGPLAPSLYELPHPEATKRAEQAVRNYDPCISCATHFLRLKIEEV